MRIFVAIVISFCVLPSNAQSQTPRDQEAIRIIRSGSQPSRQGPSENFTGSVRVDPLFSATPPARASGAIVTFEPGARTAWHTHPLGQILIVTAGTPAALAVKKATSTVPLVMVAAGDPVGTGLVPSLARPGGNITGQSGMAPDLEGKRLELLREVVGRQEVEKLAAQIDWDRMPKTLRPPQEWFDSDEPKPF